MLTEDDMHVNCYLTVDIQAFEQAVEVCSQHGVLSLPTFDLDSPREAATVHDERNLDLWVPCLARKFLSES